MYTITLGMLVPLLLGLNMSWSAISAALTLIFLDFKDARPCLEKLWVNVGGFVLLGCIGTHHRANGCNIGKKLMADDRGSHVAVLFGLSPDYRRRASPACCSSDYGSSPDYRSFCPVEVA
ncbi:hypothetical protein VPH35_127077 [Triticum aestivum]